MSNIEVQHGRPLTVYEKEQLLAAADIMRRLDRAAEWLGWSRRSWGRDAYQTALESIDTVVFIHSNGEK